METTPALDQGHAWRLTLRVAADLTTGAVFVCGLLAINARAQPLVFAMFLIAAGLLDVADGALARRAGGPTAHGAVLDVVADWVTFGLAPMVLAVSHQRLDLISLASLAFYGLAALTRLVRAGRDFQHRHVGHVGLPMPAAGGLIVGLSLLLPAAALPFGIVLVAFLAVTKRPYPSFQSLWRQDPWVSVVIGTTGAVLAIGSWETAWLTVSGAYAGYPWIKALRSQRRLPAALEAENSTASGL
jgi:CDP-diacylglycerol--serine O-phosphatidyltransferase